MLRLFRFVGRASWGTLTFVPCGLPVSFPRVTRTKVPPIGNFLAMESILTIRQFSV